MKQNQNGEPDTAMFLLLGFGSGCLLSAAVFIFLGVFLIAGENEIWSVGSLLAGLACAGLSVAIGLITALYWKYIVKRIGVLFPRLAGFKFLLAFVSAFCGSFVSISIFWFLI